MNVYYCFNNKITKHKITLSPLSKNERLQLHTKNISKNDTLANKHDYTE